MKSNSLNNFFQDEKGSVAIITAVVLFFVLIGVAALAIDIGRLTATKNELQNAADAAALGGAGELGAIYFDLSSERKAVVCNEQCRTSITTVATNVAMQNKAAGDIDADIVTVETGLWKADDSYLFYNIPSGDPKYDTPDAVKVTLIKEGSESGISTFFARFFGIDTLNVSAQAVAAITGTSSKNPQDVEAPFAISRLLIEDECSGQTDWSDKIQFRPSNSCAAFHNFYWGKNADDIRDHAINTIAQHSIDDNEYPGYEYLYPGKTWLKENFDIDVEDKNFANALNRLYGDTPIPTDGYQVGDEFNFIFGSLATLFTSGSYLCEEIKDDDKNDCYDRDRYYDDQGVDNDGIAYLPGNNGDTAGSPKKEARPLRALYDYFRYRDVKYRADDPDERTDEQLNKVWITHVPIYNEEGDTKADCSPISGFNKIIGFARIEIEYVNPPPDSDFDARIFCNFSIDDGAGTGSTGPGYVRGFIPRLVL
jgi:hypothetical protein